MTRKHIPIRLKNLETLIREAGSAVRLARAAGTNSSYLSQVRNQLPTKKGTPRATGFGPPVSQTVTEVKRNIGILRSTVSLRYDK